MAWVVVITAGIFETGFAVFLKLSHGLTKLWPTVGFAICALISFGLLTLALKHLEVGAAYAVRRSGVTDSGDLPLNTW